MAKGIFTLRQVNQAIRQGAWTGTYAPTFVEYLVVAGGGGGGTTRTSYGLAGGGGAGGLLTGMVPVTAGTSYTVTVGGGGATGTAGGGVGVNGDNSVFGSITATGGGGGSELRDNSTGNSGGSGGGSCYTFDGRTTPSQGVFGQGNNSGTVTAAFGVSGGGGAGSVGVAVQTNGAASGGVGIASAISGTATNYAGGGGSITSGFGDYIGVGGVGGGGSSGNNSASPLATAGSMNKGGGGGGGSYPGATQVGAAGGSGIVIIRYPGTTQFFTGGTLSYANGYMIHTFYANGTLAPTTPTLYANPDYQISRSIRMNQADNALFTRSVSSGNRRTWTWSGWVKRSLLQTTSTDYLPMLWTSTDQSSGSAYLQFGLYGDATSINSLNFNDQAGGSYNATTSAVFRDTSAWYHIVCAYDTTQATSTDRVKLYVNGVKQALTAGSTFQTQNAEGYFNYSSFQHKIGGYGGAVQQHQFAGYMAEVNFIDGQALTPSSFGWTNPTTGVWAPIKYVGTYGTNGFYVNFSDNSNVTAATLGADTSGNGNNWSPNNFSVSAGAGNDSLVDTPTLYGTDTGVGGEVRGNYGTWNPLTFYSTTYPPTLTNGNLDASVPAQAGLPIALGTLIMPSGQWYWEVTITAGGAQMVGIADSTAGGANSNYTTANGWYYYSGGQRYTNNTPVNYGTTFTVGDVIGVALDIDTGTLVFYKNGASQGTAYSTGLTGKTFVAALGNGSGAVAQGYTGNFGQRPFAYTAPSGYKALCTQNLPTPTIGATAATLASQFFAPVTYTGTGTARTVTVGFQPDFVWIKSRSSATWDHQLYDVIRTPLKALFTNSDSAETTYTDTLTAFTSSGFDLGTDGTYNGPVNRNGDTYVSWNWRASNATAVTNTAGSVTTQVSANPTSGFSIATFTLPASGGNPTFFTWGHGLGVAPSMIIYKTRTTATNNWLVYHASLGNTGALILNSTGAVSVSSGYFNNTSPTSTVATVNIAVVGPNSDNAVAYSFAEIAGYSKFGSYTANANADGPFIYTGFRPAFIMLHRYDASGAPWTIIDATRNPYNAAALELDANVTSAEYSAGNGMDILSNGFKLRDSSYFNSANGNLFVYMAFASTPFKYGLAR